MDTGPFVILGYGAAAYLNVPVIGIALFSAAFAWILYERREGADVHLERPKKILLRKKGSLRIRKTEENRQNDGGAAAPGYGAETYIPEDSFAGVFFAEWI